MRAYRHLTVSLLRAFLRDRAGLFWSFFLPAFFILIFGAIFSRMGQENAIKFDVGLVLAGGEAVPSWVPDVFSRVPVFTMHRGSLAGETAALRQGHRRAVIVFPEDFGARLAAHEAARLRVLYDPSQPQTSAAVVSIVRIVVAELDRSLSGAPQLLTISEERVSPEGRKKVWSSGVDFLLPGVLAMTVMQLGLFTAIPFINMREKGLLRRLRATPLPRGTFVAGQISQRLVIGFAQTLVLVALGMLVYKFRVTGSWPALFGLVVSGALTFIGIGAVLASLARTQEAGISLVQAVNFPMMFLSGMFIPLEILPPFLRPVAGVLPATYLADAMRHVMTMAASAYSLPRDVAVLAAWLAGGLLLAWRLFRWE